MTLNPNESGAPRQLKRTKARIPASACERKTLPLVAMRTERYVSRILWVFLGNPWNDYTSIRHVGHDIIARQSDSYFKLVNIRQCYSENILKQSSIISSFEHHNIATIYAVYCDGEDSFLVTEHLDICITHLKLQQYEIEEWEMATILSEVTATLPSRALTAYS